MEAKKPKKPKFDKEKHKKICMKNGCLPGPMLIQKYIKDYGPKGDSSEVKAKYKELYGD